jgi:hypothetical protein
LWNGKSLDYQKEPEMKRRTSAEETTAAARPPIAAQHRNGSDGRLAGGEAEMVAVERWENEGGMVRDP